MANTVGDLIDRVLRDWLLPPDDQPVRFTLSQDISSSATTLHFSKTLLPPEVLQILSPGVVVEIGRELIALGTVDSDNSRIENCIRGVNGTTAAQHSTGDIITLSPPYSRQSLFDAVHDAVRTLSPTLYHLHTTTLTTDTSPVEIPADYITPQALVVLSGSDPVPGRIFELLNYPPSSTSKAVIFEGVQSGLTAHLTYRARLHTPTSETQLLFTNLGIEPEWHRIIEVDVAAQMVAGRDIEGLAVERLMARIEAENFPPLTSSRVHRTLVQYHEYLIERASRQLKARDGLPQLLNGRFST